MLTVSPQYEVGTDEERGEANKLQGFAQGPTPVKMGLNYWTRGLAVSVQYHVVDWDSVR